MVYIKRYISFILTFILLLSSCSFRNEQDIEGEDAELIINENTAVFRFAAEESKTLLPVGNISQSLADALGAVYEPLYDFDEALNPVPVLAASCTRSGKLQYKVELKDNVLWHDGTEFTSSDVIYTVNALKSGESVYSADVRNIAQVDVINRHKLLFTLSEPTMNFEGLLSFPIIKRNTPLDEESEPIGTGPYKFSEKNNNTYVFVKNESWHGGEASDKTVKITLLKDKQSAVYAFEANEADVISGSLMDLSKNTPKGKVTVQDYLSRNLTFLGMNTSEGILSLPDMRRAISYLIDKNEIINRNVYGRGQAVDIPVYPKAWFYSSDANNIEIVSDGSYLEGLLNENGWYKKNGVYTKDFGSYESELTLSILVNSDNEEKMAIAKSIAKMMGDNGIIVKIKAMPYDKYLGKIKDKDFSMFIGEIAMDKNMDPSSLVKSGENYFMYSNEEMDDIINRLTSADNTEDIIGCFSEFAGAFSREMPFVPLFFRKDAMIYASNLAGFGMPNYYRPYRNIENWYFSQKVELNSQ